MTAGWLAQALGACKVETPQEIEGLACCHGSKDCKDRAIVILLFRQGGEKPTGISKRSI